MFSNLQLACSYPWLFSYSVFILLICRKLIPILDATLQLTISYLLSGLLASTVSICQFIFKNLYPLSSDHRIKFRLGRSFQALTI